MSSYKEYVNSFKSIDKDKQTKLISMFNKVKNKELPHNYVLYKSMQIIGHDTKNVPKISSLDKIDYYDKLWKTIAWNNDWLSCESKSLAKTRSSVSNNRHDTYLKHFQNEVVNPNVPDEVQQKLLNMFDPIWELYISKYSEYKFVPCDFMVRKLIQNIEENRYLKFYPRKINHKETLLYFEELWKKICTDMNIKYY